MIERAAAAAIERAAAAAAIEQAEAEAIERAAVACEGEPGAGGTSRVGGGASRAAA